MTKAMRQFTRARVLLQQRPLTIACAVGAVVLYLALRKPAARTVEADDDAAPPCDVLTNPAWAPRLSTLTELSLAGCGLSELPETIGACVSLKKLDLAKNDLADLPSSLENLKKLEILFVLGNRRMTKVPAVLARVASLTRLGTPRRPGSAATRRVRGRDRGAAAAGTWRQSVDGIAAPPRPRRG